MAENNYINCPKCKRKYHVKAERCPTCNITPEEYAAQKAIAKKKAEQKAIKKEARTLRNSLYCTACGSVFKTPKTVTRGSIIIEIILWLCFLVPGLIYSIWRMTTRYKACPNCKSLTVIPADSPIAKKALN